MKSNKQLILDSVLTSPFAKTPVSAGAVATTTLVACAYAALFVMTIARNDVGVPQSVETVAQLTVTAQGVEVARAAGPCESVGTTRCTDPRSLLQRLLADFGFA